MRVKICGLTRLQDAVLAHSLGATDLGFIFCESPRRISVTEAGSLLPQLPSTARSIGVFKNNSLDEILHLTDRLPLSGVQLHGDESPEFVGSLKNQKPHLMIIKSIIEKNGEFLQAPADFVDCDFLLFDSANREPLSLDVKVEKPFFIAGAMNKDNALSLISRHRPSGIDLARGVEASPGIKDAKRLTEFFLTLKESYET